MLPWDAETAPEHRDGRTALTIGARGITMSKMLLHELRDLFTDDGIGVQKVGTSVLMVQKFHFIEF